MDHIPDRTCHELLQSHTHILESKWSSMSLYILGHDESSRKRNQAKRGRRGESPLVPVIACGIALFLLSISAIISSYAYRAWKQRRSVQGFEALEFSRTDGVHADRPVCGPEDPVSSYTPGWHGFLVVRVFTVVVLF